MKNMKPYIVGIDPGAKGGVSCLRLEDQGPPTLLFCEDLPYLDGRLDALTLSAMLTNWGNVDLAVIERARAMPSTDGAHRGMGATSAFNYGMSYGMILGTVLSLVIPVREVASGTWKKNLGLGKDKTAARALARLTFPLLADRFARVKDDGRAESALIALYGAQQWQRGADRGKAPATANT